MSVLKLKTWFLQRLEVRGERRRAKQELASLPERIREDIGLSEKAPEDEFLRRFWRV